MRGLWRWYRAEYVTDTAWQDWACSLVGVLVAWVVLSGAGVWLGVHGFLS